MAPVSVATTLVSSNRRRGREEARRRLRWPTRAVGWKASAPVSTPQAACQRRSTSSRSQASRSDSPSKAWRTMTVRHHSGRNGGPTLGGVGVAVGEVVVSEHGMTVVGQQPIDRPLPQAVTEDLPRIVEALLDLCRPECHASNSCRTGRKSRAFGCDYFSSLLVFRVADSLAISCE